MNKEDFCRFIIFMINGKYAEVTKEPDIGDSILYFDNQDSLIHSNRIEKINPIVQSGYWDDIKEVIMGGLWDNPYDKIATKILIMKKVEKNILQNYFIKFSTVGLQLLKEPMLFPIFGQGHGAFMRINKEIVPDDMYIYRD